MPPFGRSIDPQHAPRRGVHQPHASVGVDHQHAFDHAGEDRFHPRAIAREVGCALSEPAHRIVEHVRDGSNLVALVINRRRLQVARGVFLRAGREAIETANEHHRRDPRHRERADDR